MTVEELKAKLELIPSGFNVYVLNDDGTEVIDVETVEIDNDLNGVVLSE